MKLTIGLNIILALILGTLIILYLNGKDNIAHKSEEILNNIKYDTIKPSLPNVSPNSDLIDFLFTVQDFYVYNPQAYEEMIENLESHFKLVQNIFMDKDMYTYYYTLAETKKNNALNAFQSLIFKLPVDKEFTHKFNRAHERLETILNKSMNDIYDKCQSNMIEYGKTCITTTLNKGPAGYNIYNDEIYSYQFY
jgi:hypothetical protein